MTASSFYSAKAKIARAVEQFRADQEPLIASELMRHCSGLRAWRLRWWLAQGLGFLSMVLPAGAIFEVLRRIDVLQDIWPLLALVVSVGVIWWGGTVFDFVHQAFRSHFGVEPADIAEANSMLRYLTLAGLK